jgi:hypothetical protein
MAGNLSTYLQAARANWYKGTTYPAAPANTYVALFTTVPNQANSGGVEVSGTGYVRVAIPSSGWGSITGSGPWQIATNAQTSFGNAGSSWGTVLGLGLYDASSSGNLLEVFTLAQSITVNSGQLVSFASGIITVTESGACSQYLADARLNWFKGTAYPTAPANTYAALFTAMPDPTNASGTEASGGAYARAAIASSGWSALTGTNPTSISNSGVLTFTTPTASWGLITGVCLFDASSSGDLLELNTLSSAQYVNAGAIVSFAASSLAIQED